MIHKMVIPWQEKQLLIRGLWIDKNVLGCKCQRKGVSAYTPDKQSTLNRIVGKLCGVCLMHSWMNPVFIDATAGDGRCSYGCKPSPEIICDNASGYAPILIERDPRFCELLRLRFRRAVVHCGEWQQVIPNIVLPELISENVNSGFAYFDHNGKFPSGGLDVLREISRMIPYLDIVVNVCATGLKRANDSTRRIRESIDREYFWLSPPVGAFQWTFIVATATNKLDMRKEGLVRHDSDDGKAICDVIDNIKGKR